MLGGQACPAPELSLHLGLQDEVISRLANVKEPPNPTKLIREFLRIAESLKGTEGNDISGLQVDDKAYQLASQWGFLRNISSAHY